MTATIPEGERFFNFEDAQKLKRSFLLACELFEDYQFVQLPTLEVYSPNSWGLSPFLLGTQGDGNILALRSDWTLSLMRFLNSLREVKLPLRVFYWGPVFSPKEMERFQMGIELIGEPFPEGEYEVIKRLIEYLKAMGLKDLSVILGHTQIVRGLCKEGHTKERLRKKSFYGLKEDEPLYHLLRAYGGEEVLEEFSGRFKEFSMHCEELRQVGSLLRESGIKVLYDLSEIRVQEYYTGMIFEVFHPEVGYPIAGGGRYDELFLNSKAVGGAVYLDLLLEVL